MAAKEELAVQSAGMATLGQWGQWIHQYATDDFSRYFGHSWSASNNPPRSRKKKESTNAHVTGSPALTAALRNRGGNRGSIAPKPSTNGSAQGSPRSGAPAVDKGDPSVASKVESSATPADYEGWPGFKIKVPSLNLGLNSHKEATPSRSEKSARGKRRHRAGSSTAISRSAAPTASAVNPPAASIAARSGQAEGEACSAQDSSRSGVVAQLDEFIRRGTPRPSSSGPGHRSSSASRGPVVFGSPSSRQIVERALAGWARAQGLPFRCAPRLVSWRVVQADDLQAADSLDATEQAQLLASIIWRGVEIQLELAVATLANGAGVGDTSRSSGEDGVIVIGAHTDCAWAGAQVSVATAAHSIMGKPVEVFLDSLSMAWQANERRGSISDISGAGAYAVGGHCSDSMSIGDVTPASHMDWSAANMTVASPSASMVNEIQPKLSFPTDHSTSASPSQCSGASPLPEATFRDWLEARPPAWRFLCAARGLAWDYPPSKAEKNELLLCQLFAEERRRSA